MEPKSKAKDRESKVHQMSKGHKLEMQGRRKADPSSLDLYQRFSLMAVLHQQRQGLMLTRPYLVRCLALNPDSKINRKQVTMERSR